MLTRAELIKEALDQNQKTKNVGNNQNQQSSSTPQTNNQINQNSNHYNSINNRTESNNNTIFLPSVPTTNNKSNAKSNDLIDLNRGGKIENPILKLTPFFSKESTQNETKIEESENREEKTENEINQFIPIKFNNSSNEKSDFKKLRISEQIKLPPKESFLFANHPSLQSENYSFNNNIVILNTLFSSNTQIPNSNPNDLEKISSEMLKEKLNFLQKKKKSSFEMYR